MKTNCAAPRVGYLAISIVCLVLAALAAFDFWVGAYCYRHRTVTSLPPTSAQTIWNGSVTGSEVFLAVR